MRLLLLLIFLLGHFAAPAQEADAETVRQLAKLYGDRIRAQQNKDGSWTYPGHSSGATALHLYALLVNGATKEDPAVAAGLKYLVDNFPEGDVYSVGLYACAFNAADPKRYRKEIEAATKWLIEAQARDGTWNYQGTGSGDHSVTQFGLLGLKAGQDAGVAVPKEVFARSANHFRAMQGNEGGWSYIGRGSPSPSMSAAGLASLAICGVESDISLEILKGPSQIGRYQSDPAIGRGLRYIGKLLQNRSAMTDSYTAYAIERVGILHDRRILGTVDWYRAGITHFASTEDMRGQVMLSDAFRLLFIGKGNTPVFACKIRWGEPAPGAADIEPWNLRRRDVRHLTQEMARLFSTPLDWCSAELVSGDSNLARSPLLVLSGKGKLSLSEKELAVLKSHLDKDGTLLITPCLDDPVFKASALEQLGSLYPGLRAGEISGGHELRRMYYDLQGMKLPLLMLSSRCRPLRIFIAAGDLSLSLEKKDLSQVQSCTLANLSRYALKQKPLVERLARVAALKPVASAAEDLSKEDFSRSPGAADDGLDLPMIRLAGKDPDPAAIANFLGFMRKTLQVPTVKVPSIVDLADAEALRRHAVLFLSSDETLALGPAEIRNLKNWLAEGGFLIAESACGCDEFDRSFRQLLPQILPGAKLESIPADSPLFAEPFSQPPQLTKAAGGDGKPRDFLLGVRVDKRFAVVYSPLDLGSGLAGASDDAVPGLETSAAFRLLANLVSYGLGR
ncbi:MAG: hypothetical protein RL095_2753 [Verrucomicrobiota bacterium]|jgi:hypothetical protein